MLGRLAEATPGDREPLVRSLIPFESTSVPRAEETETVRSVVVVPDPVQVAVPAPVVVVPQVREVDVTVVDVLPAIAYAIPSAPRPLEAGGLPQGRHLEVVSFPAR